MSKIKLKSIASAITDFDLPVEFVTTSGALAEVVFKAKGMSYDEWLKVAQELKNERAQEAKEHAQRFVKRPTKKGGKENPEDSAKEAVEAIDKLIEMDLEKERAKALKTQVERAQKLFNGWDIEGDLFCAKAMERLDGISPGVIRGAIGKYGEHMNGAKRKN